MTKKPEILKLVTVAIMASGLLAGCATDDPIDNGTTAVETEKAPVKVGANAAAKNAIYAAKLKNAQAKTLENEWRDTGKIIKAAEKAAAKGDNDKAVSLANKAKQQAISAIAQKRSEEARYAKNHGTTTMGMSDNMNMSSSDSDYTVVSGDNLWNISAKDSVYGNPYQWPLIYKANADSIKDADLIYAGQVFSIPSASSSDVSAAVQHAKSRGAWTIGESESSDQDYLAK